MIQKICKPGSDFRAVLDYNLRPAKHHDLLGGTMAAESARGLAREFGEWRIFNENVTKPVFHGSLSAAPEDQLTPERWLDVAGTYVGRLGYGDSPWVAIRHGDTDHDHVHLIACRIDSRGRRVGPFLERRRGVEICRQIERELGLHRFAPRSKIARAAPSRSQLAAFEQTGLVTVKSRLQEHLDLAARDHPTMRQFVERLEAHGIEVRARFTAAGQVSGISFGYDGVAFKGSDLGRGYGWLQLQRQQQIAFEPDRDLPALTAAAGRATTRMAAKRPLVRDPAAAPMPELPHPSRAFDQAAVLEARADLQERRDQLAAGLVAARDAAAQARRRITEAPLLDQAVAEQRRRLGESLDRIYRQPELARRRLADSLTDDGPEVAARTLEQRAQAFGALRGHAVGKRETPARRDALDSAAQAARELRQLVDAATAAQAGHANGEAVARALHAGEQLAAQAAAALGLLPDRGLLRRDLVRAGRALGGATVQALSPRAVHAFAAAARALGRTVLQALGQRPAPGRDDHGLGR